MSSEDERRPEGSESFSQNDSGASGPTTPAADGTVEGAAPDEEHRPEGLDLARAAARAAASLPGAPPRKRSSGGPQGTRRRRRGTPGQVSGAHPDDRDPQLLGNAMERLVAHRGWELDLKVQGVFARWAELVGEEIGAHSTPESFADAKLTVRTDSTAWATQLKLLAPSVVRRLNEELGDGTVTFIEVLGPHLPSWKKGRYGVRDGRGPRDTYG